MEEGRDEVNAMDWFYLVLPTIYLAEKYSIDCCDEVMMIRIRWLRQWLGLTCGSLLPAVPDIILTWRLQVKKHPYVQRPIDVNRCIS